MTSLYIPKQKQPVKKTLLTRIRNAMVFSFYVGKVKVQSDHTNGVFRLGVTAFPKYHQYQLDLGFYVINVWYRG